MTYIRIKLSPKENAKVERLKYKYKVNNKEEAIKMAIREVKE